MSIRRTKRKDKFTIIDNRVFGSGMSFRAIGVLTFLLSKPDEWVVSVSHLVKTTKESANKLGRDSVYSILKELQDLGFVQRIQVRDNDGKIKGTEYVVYDSPQPLTSKPYTAEPDTAESTLVNTDLLGSTENDSNSSVPSVPEKKKRIVKPDVWKEFYQQYPEHRRGGSDKTAWDKAKKMRLTENDFNLMLSDVINRKSFHSEWQSGQYVQGITKYINDELWLTPINNKQQSTDFAGQQSVSNWAEGLENEFYGVNK